MKRKRADIFLQVDFYDYMSDPLSEESRAADAYARRTIRNMGLEVNRIPVVLCVEHKGLTRMVIAYE